MRKLRTDDRRRHLLHRRHRPARLGLRSVVPDLPYQRTQRGVIDAAARWDGEVDCERARPPEPPEQLLEP